MEIDCQLINTPEALQALADVLLQHDGPIGFDIETGHNSKRDFAALKPELAFICGFSLSDSPSRAWYVPIAHQMSKNIPPDQAADIVRPVLEQKRIISHNAKFEMRLCQKSVDEGGLGIQLNIFSDTILEAYILQETQEFGLKALARKHLDYEQSDIFSLWPSLKPAQKKKINFAELDVSQAVVDYGGDDAAVCLALHRRNYDKVKDRFIFKVEMQLLPVIVKMETDGLYYDWEILQRTHRKANEFLALLQEEILVELEAATGRQLPRVGKNAFNLGSPNQLAAILFEDMGLPVYKKSERTGMPSTDAVSMEKLRREHPVVEKILWWRNIRKLISSYLDKYPQAFNYASDGRTHPDVKQTGVVTGRFAIKDPPYQQTPKAYNMTLASGQSFQFNFRECIKSQLGRYLLYFDYSQIELRVVAGEAQEPALLTAFRNNEDVHTATAATMLRIRPEDVTSDKRQIGKTMNFALLYGMGTRSLSQRLAIPIEEARQLYSDYFSAFSAISAWQENAKSVGIRRGWSESKFGRRHKIWELESTNPGIYAKGERITVNAPIQGGAADYVKVAMVRSHKALSESHQLNKVRLVMNNHDSLTWEVDDDIDPADIIALLEEAVVFPVENWPPMNAEWAVGRNWADMVELHNWQAVKGWSINQVLETGDSALYPDADWDLPQAPVVEQADTADLKSADREDHEGSSPSGGTESTESTESTDPPSRQPVTVLVEMDHMPTHAQLVMFKEELNHGVDTIVMVTPQGNLEIEARNGSRERWPLLKQALGSSGVNVRLDEKSIATVGILKGISL